MNDTKRQFLSLLGLARRAGKLAMGNDAAIQALQKGRVTLVLLASDLSPRTEKGIRTCAEEAGVLVVKTTACMDEIGAALGKRTGIAAVLDAGFAKRLCLLAQDRSDG